MKSIKYPLIIVAAVLVMGIVLVVFRGGSQGVVALYPSETDAPTGEPIIVTFSSDISSSSSVDVSTIPSIPASYGVINEYLVIYPSVELDNEASYTVNIRGVLLSDGTKVDPFSYQFTTKSLAGETNPLLKPNVPFDSLHISLGKLPHETEDFSVNYFIKNGTEIVYKINLKARLNDADLYLSENPYTAYIQKLDVQAELANNFILSIGVDTAVAAIFYTPVDYVN